MSFSLTLFPAPSQGTTVSEEGMGSHLGSCGEEHGEGGLGASTEICGWGGEGQVLGLGKEGLKKKGLGLPRWLSGNESACQCRRWQPTPVFLPGKFQGQRYLAGYSPWGHKESDTTERLSRHAPSELSNPDCLALTSTWSRTSLVVQWLRFHVPNAGGMDSIPGLGGSAD